MRRESSTDTSPSCSGAQLGPLRFGTTSRRILPSPRVVLPTRTPVRHDHSAIGAMSTSLRPHAITRALSVTSSFRTRNIHTNASSPPIPRPYSSCVSSPLARIIAPAHTGSATAGAAAVAMRWGRPPASPTQHLLPAPPNSPTTSRTPGCPHIALRTKRTLLSGASLDPRRRN